MKEALLVHESESLVCKVKSLLENKGYEVTCVENGKAALQNVTGLKYDVFISGLNIPKINCIELIKSIRLRNNCVPIIILSSTKNIETAVEAMRTGADDLISEKTENFEEKFLLVIKRAIQLKRAERRLWIYESNLPICMHCKKIRYKENRNNYKWVSIEEYFNEKMSGVNFSHGICPDCIKKYHTVLK